MMNGSQGQSERQSKSKTDMHCIIHCTDSTEKLVMLPSMESWKKLIEAAKIRQNQTVLNLAESTKFEVIKNKREVMIIFLIKVFT